MDIRAEAAKYYWYHCVELRDGVVTDGVYDMKAVLLHYGFPEEMNDWCVLDVGRGSGFFSFEFERRGARVIATDIPSFLDWDFVGGDRQRESVLRGIVDEQAFSEQHILGAFELARRLRNSQVQSKLINIYELDPAKFGNRGFDLVFVGSVTSHLRDPMLAFERLFKVTKGLCIVAAPVFSSPGLEEQPLMRFQGAWDEDRRSWWVMNEQCLLDMMKCVGFTKVRVVSRFNLVHRHIPGMTVPHAVIHGYGPGSAVEAAHP